MRSWFERVFILFLLAPLWAAGGAAASHEETLDGPAWADFRLTLDAGWRQEAAGPFYFHQEIGSQTQWGVPPFFCRTLTPEVDWSEWDVFYPVLTWRRFGAEYRLQLGQLLSFSGGKGDPQTPVDKFTIFPIYFQQRSPNPEENFTAFVPFGGEIKNRLFHDDIKFIMFPFYATTLKKGLVTDNYLYPFFHLRHGPNTEGWQLWPLVGVEHRAPSIRTNVIDEIETVGGYDHFFAAFPFFFKNRTEIGTTNEGSDISIIPFYTHAQSPSRTSTSYGWPFGYTTTDDRENKYTERSFIWPLFVQARGSKYVNRYFPFYSQATNGGIESDYIMWPLYKWNKLEAPPLERTRTRLLFFLYSDIVETNSETQRESRLTDFWPFYEHELDEDGRERTQSLAVLEPLFPKNRAMRREYSQVWSFWRDEKNPKTGVESQSLLWNLYRREETPAEKNISLFFGLFKYHSGEEGSRLRLFYLLEGRKPAAVQPPPP